MSVLGPGSADAAAEPALFEDVVSTLRAAGCVFAEQEAAHLLAHAGRDGDRLDELVRRRSAGEPLELVVGYAEFAGLRITAEAGVFVPRQRSMRLVERAVLLAEAGSRGPLVVVDLGCGSGALLAAVASRVDCTGYAIDCSARAVRSARRNLPAGTTVLLGDGFAPLPSTLRRRVDLVLANLPYVPTPALGLLPREARLYEPASALDGGADGLGPYAAAVAQLEAWLHPDGHYLAELHRTQLTAAEKIARQHGWSLSPGTGQDDDDHDGTAVVELSSPPRGTAR